LREAIAAQQVEIQQLREELRKRDLQFQQLQNSMEATRAAVESGKLALLPVKPSINQQTVAADLQNSAQTSSVPGQPEQKGSSGVEALLGRFRPSGDVRLRYDNAFQAAVPDRHRERIRLRLGVEGRLNEDFTAGMYLASGVISDPTSTNETLSNVFERKNVAWDRGWITFQPRAAKWLQLTGGKFAFTWQRTDQTFDSDLNPEGLSQKLSFDLKNAIVKNISFIGMQLLFHENARGADSFAAGGQVSGELNLGKRLTIKPSFTALNWRNQDIILSQPASVTGSGALECTLVAGIPSCVTPLSAFAPNGMTNALVTAGTSQRFASQFFYADAIIDATIQTGVERLPLRLLLEYENNLRAASSASHLYLADISLGQLKDRNDLMFGYGFWRQEQDSVIASFAESDQRAPTNVLQHRLFARWQVRKNTTASYTLWVGRTLNSSLQNAVLAPGITPGQVEPYLKRMQFDLIYKF
jgi:hypothetical protein